MTTAIKVQVETGTLAENNAAFVYFYTPHYKHYTDWNNDTEVRLFGLVDRWDGSFGFPGGKVDEKPCGVMETLKETALREAVEEVGADNLDEDKLNLVCSHQAKKGFNTHLFTYEVGVEELYQLQHNSLVTSHGRIEGSNCLLVRHANDKSVYNLMNNSALASTVKEEIDVLVEGGLM